MEIIVKGVRITLIDDQIKQIEAHKSKQAQECTTFTKTLKSFGLKKISTKGWVNPDANCWHTENWFVEILDNGKPYEYCIVPGVGISLEKSGWPLTVWSSGKLCEILNKALEIDENKAM